MKISWLQEIRSVELNFNNFDRFDVNGNNWLDDNNGLSRGMTLDIATIKYHENIQKHLPRTLHERKYSISFQKGTKNQINKAIYHRI